MSDAFLGKRDTPQTTDFVRMLRGQTVLYCQTSELLALGLGANGVLAQPAASATVVIPHVINGTTYYILATTVYSQP